MPKSKQESRQLSKLIVRNDIHDMDKRIARKLKHIREELSFENIQLIEECFN